MKKLLALLLAMMMIFSLAACGDNNKPDPDKDNPGTSQGGENNNKNISISTASIEDYELPDVALAYVGTFNNAYNYQYNDGEITFYVKSTNADDDAFDALIDYYASNGGTLDSAKSTSTTKCFDFEWGRIEVSHFGADKEISAYIILPEYPIANNGGNEGTVDPGPSGDANVLHELFDIQQLASITAIPDFAKKAIGDLRWCDDLGADNQFKYYYNVYMKEVTQEDFNAYIANLTANAPTNSEEGENFGFYWDWGQITGTYFPDSGTLDVNLSAK